MLKSPKTPEQRHQNTISQRQIRLGDLFELLERKRTIWTVEKLLDVRNLTPQAAMSQVDGLGRVTVSLDEPITEIRFKRIDQAVI